MSRFIPLCLALCSAACGRIGMDPVAGASPDGSAAAGGATATGGAATTGGGGVTTTGGATASGGAAGGTSCPSSGLSSAPLECMQDWTNAKLRYKSACRVAQGGYQASCGKYDAILVESTTTEILCFYDRGTGNLIGATTSRGASSACLSFDFGFTPVAVADCAPASTTGCGGDAGTP